MATANSTRRKRAAKDFPLWKHQSGHWCKKIRGKFHYFGKDKLAALDRWLAEKDDLLAGRTPRTPDVNNGITVKYAANHLLTIKKQAVEAGELSQRQFEDLKRAGEMVVDYFGRERSVVGLRPDDFRGLRTKLARVYSPTSLKREIANIRSIFNSAYKNDLVEHPVKFGTQFSIPKKETLRKARQDVGERMMEPSELRAVLDAACVHMKAITLLALNSGLGNADIAFLERRHLDLENGWLTYRRRKTGVPRRAKLWDETVAAVNNSLDKRTKHKSKDDANIVFMTRYGKPWGRLDVSDSAITKAFRKLLDKHDLYQRGRSFYTLRHIYRTIADETKDQPAVDFTMGHDDGRTANAYRERISDERLGQVAAHVRTWLFGGADDE